MWERTRMWVSMYERHRVYVRVSSRLAEESYWFVDVILRNRERCCRMYIKIWSLRAIITCYCYLLTYQHQQVTAKFSLETVTFFNNSQYVKADIATEYINATVWNKSCYQRVSDWLSQNQVHRTKSQCPYTSWELCWWRWKHCGVFLEWKRSIAGSTERQTLVTSSQRETLRQNNTFLPSYLQDLTILSWCI